MQSHIAYIIDKLAARKPTPKRVLVQAPSGLKARVVQLLEALQAKGYDAVLAADDCFGACDLPLAAAEVRGADAILHIGHIPFYKEIKSDIPIIYYEWPLEVQLNETKLRNEISKVKERRLGIVSSVQYLHVLPKIAEILLTSNKTVEIGGHVLGCWAKNAEQLAAKADAILFVGSGMFHPRGFKCDYFLDLERGEIRDIRNEINKWEKVRWGRISRAKDAKAFGILVSIKPGQLDMERAKQIKAELEKRDKKAFILVMDKISDSVLMGLAADAFINTACPRLGDDNWSKPFVNAADFDKMFE